jgi:hypothetical protein
MNQILHKTSNISGTLKGIRPSRHSETRRRSLKNRNPSGGLMWLERMSASDSGEVSPWSEISYHMSFS